MWQASMCGLDTDVAHPGLRPRSLVRAIVQVASSFAGFALLPVVLSVLIHSTPSPELRPYFAWARRTTSRSEPVLPLGIALPANVTHRAREGSVRGATHRPPPDQPAAASERCPA
jgi:hypothetical protein